MPRIGKRITQKWRKYQDYYLERKRRLYKEDKFLGRHLRWNKEFINFCDLKGRILDVGCGTFYNDNNLHLAGYYGMDVADFKSRSFPFAVGVGEGIPFKNAVFDTVLLVAVLDHVIKPEVVIKEVSRVLKEGGMLYVAITVHDNKIWLMKDMLARIVELLLAFRFRELIRGAKNKLKGEHVYHFKMKDVENFQPFFETTSIKMSEVIPVLAYIELKKQDL